MRGVRQRLRKNSGMTLVETLVALALVAILTTVILTGSQAAFQVYGQSTFMSESQMVSSNIDEALSDVLRYATAVVTDSEGKVTAYTNSSYGITDGFVCVGTSKDGNAGSIDDYGMIYLNYEGTNSVNNMFLLSNLSYSGLVVVPVDYSPGADSDISSFELYYADGVFTGEYRLYDPVNSQLSDVFDFSFRTVNS